MQLRDELEEIDKKIEKAKILKDSYQSAVDILSESVDEFYHSYSKVLEEHVTEIFEKMTGNTNRSVSLGKDFSPFYRWRKLPTPWTKSTCHPEPWISSILQ